jgi:serine-type D-Ala-D-Ala carboxypeptidase (penicillin-binding protein 5/6)
VRPARIVLALGLLLGLGGWTNTTVSAPDAVARAAPGVEAPAAIVVDARDGYVLYRRSAEDRRPIASTTKLMTALVSLEKLPLERRLRAAPYHAAAAESQIALRAGERMSVADLLRALMLESANDAAATLARGAAGSTRRFVRLMNRKARELRLAETHYANPIGLDEPGNYSSARDLSRLARLVLRDDFLAETVQMPRARLLTGSRERVVDNRNDLVGRVRWIKGVKTGHTAKAGYVLVGAGRRKSATLVSVVLGARSEAARDTDTLRLLDYGFGFYRRIHPLRSGDAVTQPKVAFYGDRRVALRPARSVALALRHGEHVRTTIDVPGELHGPLGRGARVGTASVLVNGRQVTRVALLTSAAVPRAGLPRKVAHYVVRPLLVLALLTLVVLAADKRRRRLRAVAAARRRRAAASNR